MLALLINLDTLTASRRKIFEILKQQNIGVIVYYIKVDFHSYYQQKVTKKDLSDC
jgi:dTDP-4-amino-4,6-dideoxygalactose transaminase